MKSILIGGMFCTAFIYIIISLFNHSWNAMTWSQDSVYWFGCLSGLGWFASLMMEILDLNKTINDKPSPYDEVFGKRKH